MIRELNKNYEPHWNEKLEISLSLRELQLIYDCIGAVPFKYINCKHEKSKFYKECTAEEFNTIYSNLDDIIRNHNGVTDDDRNVNINLELDIVGEEE